MIQRFSAFLFDRSSGRIALLAAVIFLLFGALVLPREAERAERVSRGAGSPDTNLFYSADDLYELARIYGPEGRSAYVRARFTFDLAFPFVYGFFLVSTIGWFGSRVLHRGSRLRNLNLVPVLGLSFDLLENLSTSFVMLRYPLASPVVAAVAPVFSLIKWLFVYGSFLVLGLLVLVWVAGSLRRALKPPGST